MKRLTIEIEDFKTNETLTEDILLRAAGEIKRDIKDHKATAGAIAFENHIVNWELVDLTDIPE